MRFNIMRRASGSQSPAPAGSWSARSTAAGVVAAYGMDSPAEVAAGYRNGDNGPRGFFDPYVKCGSGGSLRFDLRAGETGANIAGSWTKLTAPWVFTQGFGQGQTFYVQYRARITQSMLDNLDDWNSVWKQIIIHQGNATCANIEITHTHPDNGSTIYLECGARHAYTTLTTPDHTESTPLLWQQDWDLTAADGTREANGYQSQYPTVNWLPPTDEWYTVYFKVHIGTLTSGGTGPKDSTIEMWIAGESDTAYRKVIACRIAMKFDSSTSDVFNNLTLTPFMTGLTTSSPDYAAMWIDQLIISSQPIAFPEADHVVATPSYFPASAGIVTANSGTFYANNVPAYQQAGFANGSEPWAAVQGVRALFMVWNGGVYVQTLGTLGSLLFHGGGHNGYFGNEVYRFDIATRAYSRLNMPTYPFSLDYARGELGSGQPMSTHTYSHLQYSPVNGEMVLATHASDHEQGGTGATIAHHFTLASASPLVAGSGWSRGGAYSHTPPGLQYEGMSAYDSNRNYIYHAMSSATSPLWRYNVATRTHTQLTTTNQTLDSMWEYVPTIDAVIMSDRRSGSVLRGWDPNVPGTAPFTLNEGASNRPSGGAHGFSWCGATGEIAAYEYGSNVLRFLRPPTGNWKTGTWTWRTVSLGSSIPIGSTGGQSNPYNQFRWISALPNDAYFAVGNGVPDAFVIRGD